MKIIIDIPEERFADIQRIASVQINRRTPTVEQIIANGTPLDEYMVKAEKENFIQTCEVFRERIDEV